MFWKKHRPRCFWRCSKKAETSCSRCILAMFLLTILNELKNCSKFFEICNKLWQQCVYSNNLLTKILAWQAILYQRGINIVGPNHFWRCGPRPKTSRKTSHFLLNDAMFQRCFEKNIDLDVLNDVWGSRLYTVRLFILCGYIFSEYVMNRKNSKCNQCDFSSHHARVLSRHIKHGKIAKLPWYHNFGLSWYCQWGHSCRRSCSCSWGLSWHRSRGMSWGKSCSQLRASKLLDFDCPTPTSWKH